MALARLLNRFCLAHRFFWFGSWWVPGASGRAPEVAETPTDGPGVPPGAPGARGSRATNIKTHICCGALLRGRAWGPVDVDSFSARWFGRKLIVVQHSRAGDHSRLSLLIWPPSPRSKAMKKGMKKAAAHAEEAHPAKKAMKKAMKAKK